MNHRLILGWITSILTASTLFVAAPAFADPEPPSQAEAQPETPANPEMKPLLEAIKAQDWETASKEGENYTQKFADDPMGWTQLGIAYTNLENFEKALECFEKAAEHGDNSNDNKRNRAVLSVSVNRPNAVDLMLETAKTYPQDDYIQFLTGQTLATAGKKDEALTYFEKAIELAPNNLGYITNTTSFVARQGNNIKAAEISIKAIESGTESSTLYINTVVYYINAGMFEEALKWADKGIERKSDSLLVYHKGRCLLRLGRLAEAEEVLREFKDTMYNGTLNYAMTKMMMGCDAAKYPSCSTPSPDPCCANEKEALELYEELKPEVPNNKPDIFSLYCGLALALTGDTTTAEELLHANLSQSKPALRSEQLMAIAIISWLGNDQNNAIRLYNSALSNLPELQNNGNIDSFATKHVWPSRAADALKAVREAAVAAEPTKDARKDHKKSACGCELTRESTPPGMPFLLMLLFGLGALVLRRRHP